MRFRVIYLLDPRLLIIKALANFLKASLGPHFVNCQTHKRVLTRPFYINAPPSIDHGSMALHAR